MTIVNRATGEITERANTSTLVVADKSTASVVTLLEQAKSWLATCVEMTGPAEIAAAKAQIVTAETYARELRLSKDIQMDAQEMVRRAEYALGKSIRKGQAEGEIRVRGDRDTVANQHGLAVHVDNTNSGKASPYAFASQTELDGNGAGIYALADSAEPEQFDAALTEAKAEGNLSRANVVRKIKGQSSGAITRDMRADMITNLANQGYSSRQMPNKVGVSEETVRQIARDFGIDIPADKAIGGTRRINSTDIVANTVTALEGLVMGVELIDYDDLDSREAGQWADSLTYSLRALNRFAKQIKETAHD